MDVRVVRAGIQPEVHRGQAMTGYPIELDVAGRRVVVVGGGRVAMRRARRLLDAGALVTVIAPEVRAEFAELGASSLTVLRRPYLDGDLDGAWLVHAATDDPDVNEAVATTAEQRRIWCVRADAGQGSAARMPAVARHGDVTVAVTSGGDPRRSQRLRSAIGHALALGELPLRARRRSPDLTSVPAGEASPGRPQRHAPGRRRAGHVALVGGGPGDPGLMTVLGRRLLAEADVVVADRLGPREVLAELDPDVEIIEAGKAPGAHRLTQEQINDLIVERALAGQRVVRLKGGDPFIFGRGGEEALACVRAGVPVQVVPGVTSAVAVPAYAGIPVTHRGITQDFAVVSAHLDPSQPGASVDWAALAAGSGTLVLLMAMAHLDQITAELIKRGKDPATPVAVIQDGTTGQQRTLVSTLKEVAADAARHGIGSPAVVVIGEVVRLRDELAVVSELTQAASRNAARDRERGAA